MLKAAKAQLAKSLAASVNVSEHKRKAEHVLDAEALYYTGEELASYPGSLIIAGEEKRAWFQSLAHALNLTC